MEFFRKEFKNYNCEVFACRGESGNGVSVEFFYTDKGPEAEIKSSCSVTTKDYDSITEEEFQDAFEKAMKIIGMRMPVYA